MWLVGVREVMSEDTIAISKNTTVDALKHLLDEFEAGTITHHAFPVVDCHHTNDRLRGIITIENIKKAIKEGEANIKKAIEEGGDVEMLRE